MAYMMPAGAPMNGHYGQWDDPIVGVWEEHPPPPPPNVAATANPKTGKANFKQSMGTFYQGFDLRRLPISEGGKHDWSLVKRSEILLSPDDLSEIVKQREKTKKSPTTIYNTLLTRTQQQQIDEILAEKNPDRQYPDMEWVLADIRREEDFSRQASRENHAGEGNGRESLAAIRVIIKRQRKDRHSAAPGKRVDLAKNGTVIDLSKPKHKEKTTENRPKGDKVKQYGVDIHQHQPPLPRGYQPQYVYPDQMGEPLPGQFDPQGTTMEVPLRPKPVQPPPPPINTRIPPGHPFGFNLPMNGAMPMAQDPSFVPAFDAGRGSTPYVHTGKAPRYADQGFMPPQAGYGGAAHYTQAHERPAGRTHGRPMGSGEKVRVWQSGASSPISDHAVFWSDDDGGPSTTTTWSSPYGSKTYHPAHHRRDSGYSRGVYYSRHGDGHVHIEPARHPRLEHHRHESHSSHHSQRPHHSGYIDDRAHEPWRDDDVVERVRRESMEAQRLKREEEKRAAELARKAYDQGVEDGRPRRESRGGW